MIKKFGNYLLAGTVVALPLTVTLFVIVFLIRNIGAPVSQLLFAPIFRRFDAALPSAGLGGLALDLSLHARGVVLHNASRRPFQILFRADTHRDFGIRHKQDTGVGLVYRTVKQIVDTFSKQNKAVFQSVVMLEFPRAGLYAVGLSRARRRGKSRSAPARSW